MAAGSPHAHSHPGPHPAAPVPASLLRLSAPQRLVIAAVLATLLWAAVYWAMS
jgi:hypothetical protein